MLYPVKVYNDETGLCAGIVEVEAANENAAIGLVIAAMSKAGYYVPPRFRGVIAQKIQVCSVKWEG